jgi:predicted Zn-dependent peptidase
MRHVLDKIKENLYEEPFGYSGLGRSENVRSFDHEKLKRKHDEVYVAKNSILCVVGNNDFEDVVALAERFSPEKEVGNVDIGMPEIVLRNEDSEEKRGNLEQANVVLGVHFPKASEKDVYAAEIFSAILGRGMSSKLFSEVREKRGLVYGVKSDLDVGRDYGYFIIWAGTDPGKIEEVKRICLKEFSKMESLTEKELSAAKVQVVGNRVVENEGSDESAIGLMFSEIHGRAEDYYDFEKKVNKVSLDDVCALAKKSDFASFSLGP